MLRAVIYSRHSTDQQNPRSAADQTRLCRSFAEAQGWQVVDAYEDHAISGASKFRPEYQRLTLHAKAGRFDIVVCESLDRLGRKLADIAELQDQLSFHGITIHSVQQGQITQMHIGLLGTMAQMQLSDIRSKTTRGLRAVAQDGRSAGGLCYGYKIAPAADGASGKAVRGHRAIDEGQAIVVRRIFQDYANGLSPKASTLKLNGEGIPAPRGGSWAATAINGNRTRGTGVINNEVYVGRQIWGRQTWLKDPSTGRRLPRMAKPDALVLTEIPGLRIVSDELWHAAKARQVQLDRRGRDMASGSAGQVAFWSKQRPRYLFSGLMRCGQCGGGFSKISAEHFGCSTARNKGPTACVNRLTIRRDILERTVLSGLRERLMDPQIFREFVAGFTQTWNQLQAEASAGLSAKRQELARIGQQIERGVDAIVNGTALIGLNERLMALEARKIELERELTSVTAPAPRLHPNLPEIYRRRVADLTAVLAAGDDADARELVRGLIEEIRLVPADGHLRIEVRGELAAILRLTEGARHSKGADLSIDALSEQVKMVAGTGFEPVTFRL